MYDVCTHMSDVSGVPYRATPTDSTDSTDSTVPTWGLIRFAGALLVLRWCFAGMWSDEQILIAGLISMMYFEDIGRDEPPGDNLSPDRPLLEEVRHQITLLRHLTRKLQKESAILEKINRLESVIVRFIAGSKRSGG